MTKTHRERMARLMREDALKGLHSALWDARVLCEKGREKDATQRAGDAIRVLTDALAEYAAACVAADEIAQRSSK